MLEGWPGGRATPRGPSSWTSSVKSGQSRNSVFYSSRKYGDDSKGTHSWRRLVELVERQELTARELVAQWGCDQASMSYAEFMRGLVAVLGPNGSALTHSERKRLFESLKPNRDGRVDVEEFTRRLSSAESSYQQAAIGTRQAAATLQTDRAGSPRRNSHETTTVEELSRASARDLRMRYRRERLLAANLLLRTAMLERRPLLFCRAPSGTKIVGEGTVVGDGLPEVTGNAIVWDERTTTASISMELELALGAAAHGVSGCVVSYGGRTAPLVFAKDGLAWTALRRVYAELELVDAEKDDFVVSVALEVWGVSSSLAAKNLHWIVLPEGDAELATTQVERLTESLLEDEDVGTVVMRLRVEDRRYAGAVAELRLVSAAATDFDELDLDDADAWFSPGTSPNHAKRKKVSACARNKTLENSFAFCVAHPGDGAVAAHLADLGRRREAEYKQKRTVTYRRAAESVLPLEALKRRKAVGLKLKKREAERQPAAEVLASTARRVAELDARLRSPADVVDAFEIDLLTTSAEHVVSAADACRRQRLAAWERASRLQAALGRVQVVCRIRPLLETDADRGPPPEVRQRLPGPYAFVKRGGKGRHVVINLEGHKLASKSRSFEFDDVWDRHTSQEEVFESVENLASDALCGRTASVFAYGCTGGGKSYTVVGDLQSHPPRLGIAFQSVDLLLATLRGTTDDAAVVLSMVEVHNEEVYDLLRNDDCTVYGGDPATPSPPRSGGDSSSQRFAADTWSVVSDDTPGGAHGGRRTSRTTSSDKVKLDVRLGPGGKAHMPELTRLSIDDMGIFVRVFEAGNRRRATTATLLNEASSRSHVVVMVEAPSGGRLCLVDLAGCERIAKSGASGEALKEATCINKSLSALGDCFEAIDKRRTHVPYRNSKLTFMLQDVIGGPASRCLFVFAASPAWATVPETLSSFKFAARMSSIQLDGELLSDKQKHLDAVLALASDRLEKKLLTTFQDELQDLETRAIDIIDRDLSSADPEEVPDDACNEESASVFANESVGSDSRHHLESELATLWRRLRATEHELARLSSHQQQQQTPPPVVVETLVSPPHKTIPPKLAPRKSAHDVQDDEILYAHEIIDIDELSSPCSPDEDEPPPPLDDDDLGVDEFLAEPDDEEPVAIKELVDEPRTRDITLDIIADDALPATHGCVVSLFSTFFCGDQKAESNLAAMRFGNASTTAGKLVVGIHQASGLLPPDRDLAAALVGAATNPYVVAKYGTTEQATKDLAATVDPVWDVDLIFRHDPATPPTVTVYLFSANTYTPDDLLGKVTIDLGQNSDNMLQPNDNKPHQLLPKTWLKVQPCLDHERHLLRRCHNDKSMLDLFSRSPTFLYTKPDLGLLQVSAYFFHYDD